EFDSVSFAYKPDEPVLREVSFRVEPGKTVALVGHTGSGKTTLIQLLAKFYLPQSGTIRIDGIDLRKIRSDSVHRKMGIVLQQNFLFSGTVEDNIRIGRPEATLDQITEVVRRLDCLDLVESLPEGFQTKLGEGGMGVSLGQRQVICFARAMLADPGILILDEATSAMDTLTENRLQTALAILLKGRTSFVVAHRLSTIRHADLILVLDQGRIVESGSHRNLLRQGGAYAWLYRAFLASHG
ncbi:MAG: ATP-binding cassette domain-containing protein, partial [Kiritimatiellia bacterium]|nr:ATP-binding cassette domain-containing protein [Kiritimatiellia bacterium]